MKTLLKITGLLVFTLFISTFKIVGYGLNTINHGNYNLVLQDSAKHKNGTLKGTVNPPEAGVSVVATANAQSFKTTTNAGGEFTINDIPEGVYEVVFIPRAAIYKLNRPDVTITPGLITDLGTVELAQP